MSGSFMMSSSHTWPKCLSSTSTKQWMNSRIASSFCAAAAEAAAAAARGCA
jgi:hypothetical protein